MEAQIDHLVEEEDERAQEAEADDAMFYEEWEGEEAAALAQMNAIDIQYEALYAQALGEEDEDRQFQLFEEADEVYEQWYEWNDIAMEAGDMLAPVRQRMEIRSGAEREALAAEEAFELYEEQETIFMEKEEMASELRAQWEEADEAGRAELEEQKKALEREEEKFRRDMEAQAVEQAYQAAQQERTAIQYEFDERFRIADE